MDKITWKKSKVEGRTGVSVPYNAVFNEQLQAAVPSAKFERQPSAWFIDEEAKEEVIPLLEKFYLNTSRYRVTWDIKQAGNILIDGARLMWVNRDHYKFSHDHGLAFKVVENTLDTSGSRANPYIYGRLVLEISLREGAVIEPAPTEMVAMVEDETAVRPNQLAAFPTSDLVAELERRGQASETAAQEAIKAILTAVEKSSRVLFEEAIEKAKHVIEYA